MKETCNKNTFVYKTDEKPDLMHSPDCHLSYDDLSADRKWDFSTSEEFSVAVIQSVIIS